MVLNRQCGIFSPAEPGALPGGVTRDPVQVREDARFAAADDGARNLTATYAVHAPPFWIGPGGAGGRKA